jgi:hypothetical protein
MFKIARIMLAVALVTMGISSMASAQLPGGWKLYSNNQFGYKSCYPVGMQQIKESTDAGGTAFFSSSGTLGYSAENNRGGRTLIQYVKAVRDPSREMVQTTVGNGWVIETGMQFDQYMWSKSFKRGNRMITVSFTEANLARYSAMVTMINACTTID